MTPNDNLVPIIASARELYGRVVYTHITHEKEREIWSAKVCRMNNINIWLAGATTFFAIISASLQPAWGTVVTAIFAAATIAFVMWQSNLDPAGREAQHRVAAKELLWIREQLLLLITDRHISPGSSDHAQKCLEVLTRELTTVYKFAPNTSPQAYAAAEKSIKSGHFTFSNEEIDGMLPVDLRKTQS